MTEEAPAPSPWHVYTLVAGAIALSTLNFSLVFVAFGDIERSFDASPTTVSWALTAFSITTAAVFVPAGWAADRFGRANMFLIGFGTFIVGSLLVSIAPNVEFLIFARVIQAVGLATESPASLALVLDAFPPERRSTAVGALGAVGGVSAALGPAVGGALIDTFTWRWAFFLNVPLGIVVFIFVAPRLPRPAITVPISGRIPDLIGVFLLMVGVAALALGIVQSDDWGYVDPKTLTALMIAIVFISVLIKRSRTHEEPILYLPLFKDHDFRYGSAVSFVVGGTFAGVFLTCVQLMNQGWGLSLLRSGLAVGLIPAVGGPMSIVAGRIADRYGHRAVILPGTVLMALSGLWMYVRLTDDRQIVQLWLPFVAIYGMGIGLAHATGQSAALSNVATERLGIGGSMNRIIQEIGQTMSAAIVIALLARAATVIDGVRSVMIMLIVLSTLGIPLASRLASRGHQPA